MGELNRLKKQAEDADWKDRQGKLLRYVEHLNNTITAQTLDSWNATLMFIVCFSLYISMAAFWQFIVTVPDLAIGALELLSIWVVFYDVLTSWKVKTTKAELRGVLKTLEIMGLLEKNDDHRPRKKKRKCKEIIKETWEQIKRKLWQGKTMPSPVT